MTKLVIGGGELEKGTAWLHIGFELIRLNKVIY